MRSLIVQYIFQMMTEGWFSIHLFEKRDLGGPERI